MTNTAQALHYAASQGQMITRKDNHGNDCSLWLQGGRFQMVKQHGDSHSLEVSETSPERLLAHWHGFCGAAPAPAPKAALVAPRLQASDSISVFRNQGDRDATVLAVAGDQALISYEMPSGVTYLNIVAADGSDEPGAYRAVSPKGLSKAWRNAVAEQYGKAYVFVRKGCGIYSQEL